MRAIPRLMRALVGVRAVASVIAPYDAVLTLDVDPSRDEIQVAAVGGRIQFDVEYPAPNALYLPGRVVVHSTKGTTSGIAIPVPNP